MRDYRRSLPPPDDRIGHKQLLVGGILIKPASNSTSASIWLCTEQHRSSGACLAHAESGLSGHKPPFYPRASTPPTACSSPFYYSTPRPGQPATGAVLAEQLKAEVGATTWSEPGERLGILA